MWLFRNFRFLKSRSLQSKLNLILFVTSFSSVTLATVAFILSDAHNFRESLSAELEETGQALIDNNLPFLFLSDYESVERSLREVILSPYVEYACLLNNQSVMLAEYSKNIEVEKIQIPDGKNEMKRFTDNHFELVMAVNEEMGPNGELKKIGALYIRSSLAGFEEKKRELIEIGGLIILISIVLIYIISNIMQHFISFPILSLSRIAEKISKEGNYDLRGLKYSDDEIGKLVDHFNEMLDQIQYRSKELEDIRSNLEGIIKERTAKLVGEMDERKKLEGKLVSIVDEYQRLLHNNPTTIFKFKCEESGALYLVLAEGQLSRSMGLSTSNVRGKPISEVFGLKMWGDSKGYWLAAVNGEAQSFEIKLNQLWYSIHLEPVVESSSVVEVIGTFSDITDRYDAMKKLAEAKEIAEEAYKTKSAFLANMSHELRTPLNAILGYAQILKKNQSGFTETHKNGVNTIFSSGTHLLGLINDILEYSKLEAGKMDLHVEAFNFSGLLSDVYEMVSVKSDEKNLKLKVDFSKDLPVAVEGDEGKLKQILLNLLSNAIKFTTDGEIFFSVSRLSENKFRFCVSDTGIGIKKEDEVTVFEAFRQVLPKESLGQGGTGLGLSITRSMVELMGGALDLESELGEGSAFSFEIDLKGVEGGVEIDETIAEVISEKYQVGEELILPSIDQLQKLLALARTGDIKAIRKNVNELLAEDVKYSKFSTVVLNLADSFKVKSIRGKLRGYIAKGKI